MSEAPGAVVRRVAAILGSPRLGEETGIPSCISEVRRLQSAATAILEAELEAHDEARLLDALAIRAARAELPLLALDAIVAELRRPAPPPPAPTEWQALRRLVRARYAACPACSRAVPSEDVIDHLELRYREAQREAIRFSIEVSA